MPAQPPPKMQVQLDVSQVRSQRNTWSGSSGSVNSTHARGKSRETSGTCEAYAPAAEICERQLRNKSVACPGHLQHTEPPRRSPARYTAKHEGAPRRVV